MGGGLYLATDAPEGLNRLWFVGRLLDGRAGEGRAPERDLPEWLGREVLGPLPAESTRRARRQWGLLWSQACRRREAALLASGPAELSARPEIPADMPDLAQAEAMGAAVFAEWWAAPTGARLALAWIEGVLAGQIGGPLQEALRCRGDPTFLDIVGSGAEVAGAGSRYVLAGARGIFPPRSATLQRILWPAP